VPSDTPVSQEKSPTRKEFPKEDVDMLHLLKAARLSAVVLVLMFFASVSLRAQTTATRGTVTVVVLDPSGAIVTDAQLELRDASTNDLRTAVSSGEGTYTFVDLATGTYGLTVVKDGFQKFVQERVLVQAGRVTDVRTVLKVGTPNIVMEVHEEAAPLIETTSNALGSTIDLKQIEDLPLQGRDVSSLALLSPGFTGIQGSGTWGGLPVTAQGNTVDGVISSTSRMKFAGNSQPGLEARLEDIQEMTVQTGQTDVSQNTGTSSMQVNFVTRRGGNDYHGRVFDDFRNTALNANSWYNNATGQPRNPIILNDFGGGIGGKIIKDKLFFFASFAMAKQPGGYENGVPGSPNPSVYVLSPQAQQGIFAYSPNGPNAGQTVNLFTQVAQPNGLPAAVNGSSNGALPQVAPELAIINKNLSAGTVTPVPSDPNLERVTWAVNSPITTYYPAARVDYNVNSKLRLDWSLEMTKINHPNASPPPLPGPDFASQTGNNKSNNYITSVGLNWTITPNLINQFRGGYYYNAYWYGFGTKPLWDTLPQVSWAGFAVLPSGVGITSGQSFTFPISTYYPIVNFSDNATWQHGAHTVGFGVNFYREQDHYWNAPDGIQNLTLGLATGDPALNVFNNYFAGASSSDRGDAEGLYATLVGRIQSVAPIGSGFPYNVKTKQYATKPGSSYNLDELQKGWGWYLHDSFRVKPRLTVNYGLRWDFTGDDHDLTSAYHGTSPSAMYGPSGVGNLFKPGALTGDQNPAYVASTHQYAPWNVSPQPTIGVAWNPSYSEGFLSKLLGGSNTVIRAGFDIKRFTEPYQYFWNNASNHGLGFFQTFSDNASSTTGPGLFKAGNLALGDTIDPTKFLYSPTAYAASIPESTYTWNYYWGGAGFDPHIHQPYVMEWNFGIQRQLGQNNVLEVRYVGHRSVHQWIQEDTNEVNIFENGFLKQFQAAQGNLAACMANASCAGNPSFANQGLPGQVGLPIFDTAFRCPPGSSGCTAGADYTNSTFIQYLSQGAAGTLADQLAYPFGTVPYICNLVGSSLAPCATQYGYTSPGAYPLNIFQANPLTASYPGVTQSYLVAGGYGNYHALQVDFRQKPWHGMQFDVNYTWSHTLGLQPENYQGSGAAWLGTVNEFTLRNLRDNYGPTSFDLRHVIHASGTFDLPFGKGRTLLNRGGVLDKVVGGWTVGNILTWETGFPFQLFGGYNTFNDYGDGGFALNGVSVSKLQSAIGVYHADGPYANIINPALFGTPSGNCNSYLKGVCQNTTPGTLGYNPWLYGPHIWNDDMSLSKAISFNERIRFTFQAEALNVFNHVSWGSPNGFGSVSSPGFGQSSTLSFTNLATNNNGGQRVLELRANISF
jgi:hypothetical protein